MRLFQSINMHFSSRLFLKSVLFASVIVCINGYPQWVWNKDAIDLGNSNSNSGVRIVSTPSDSAKSPFSDSTRNNIPNGSVRIIAGQTQPRLLFSSIASALPGLGNGGGGGGSSSGGLGGIFGSVLQNIPQLATQAISGVTGIFNRPITLPGGGTNIGGGGADKEVPTNTNSCNCVEANNCFLPNKATGSCQGGKVKCCSTSKTLFPDDADTDDSTKTKKSERTVTQREVRRGLLQNILKGSGSIVDDTLDLFLHPFLSTEDQQKTAQRIFGDE